MEQLPEDAIARFIAAASDADRVSLSNIKLLSGGAIQENWSVDVQISGGPRESSLGCVLRRDSSASGVDISHGRAQEFALLERVYRAGVTVPEPLWLCTDTSVAGGPFFVMGRVGGTANAHVLAKSNDYAPDRRKLVEDLGRELARIHSIVPPDSALDFLSKEPSQPALDRVRKIREFLDEHHTPYPALEWGLRWLERHAPETPQITLCHGDFRTGNYMVDEGGLTGILDWEFTGWSDPLEDIGWFCAKCWRFGKTHLEAGGVGEREDFYRGYEQERGITIDREAVAYWEVMAHATWASIAIQQGERHCSGRESSLLLALTGHIVPELELEMLTMTEAD